MSAVGWVGRWKEWSGWASRGGMASSSEPGSGCAYTPDLWTTESLCLCSARGGWGGKSGIETERQTRMLLLEALSGPSKHITNTAQWTELPGPEPQHKLKSRPCAGFLFIKPHANTTILHSRWEKQHSSHPLAQTDASLPPRKQQPYERSHIPIEKNTLRSEK